MDIITTGAARTMTSREIAELTGKEHRNVLADIRKLFEELSIDPLTFQQVYKAGNGQSQIEFALLKRECLILVSGYSIAMRARIIDRWQELEASAAPARELSRLEILKIAMDAEQGRLKAEAALALAAPKVEFVARYVDATGTMGFREVCKLLGAKEPAFRAFLSASEILYKLGGVWVPYSRHIDAGRFVVKTGSADNGHAFSSARFTAKGVEWVSGLWRAAKGTSP